MKDKALRLWSTMINEKDRRMEVSNARPRRKSLR